jgi:ribosomal protein S18 acetylase RimI-like enzyme
MEIRPAHEDDRAAIWRILEPILRAGETYALPRDLSAADALAYWFAPGHEVFVAVDGGDVFGTYYLHPNQPGGGAHVCNCGYMTAPAASGRGVARAMCAHSLAHARQRGYRAMQYNLVVSSNQRAVRLWQSFGFEVVGRLPEAFAHPQLGFIDALVMYRML